MTEDKPFKLYTNLMGNCGIAGDDCEFGMFHKLEKKQVLKVIDKLNELYNEKKSWRESWIEEIEDQEIQSKTILQLANENEQLKDEIRNLQAKLNILEQALTGEKQ